MLICKYTRKKNAAFIPHLDMLRTVSMAVRRIGAQAGYSEGFNPHMKIFFGQPLPIGTESLAEYFCLFCDDEPQTFMQKINASLPEGVRISAAAKTEKDPNVSNLMAFADYTVILRDTVPAKKLQNAANFIKEDACVITYTQKGQEVQKDVKPLIRRIEVEGNTLRFRLSCGNRNLRADRLMAHLKKAYAIEMGYDIVKTAMYDEHEKNLDDLFFGGGD
ncbi:MAG: TIGR03936 family radical SAM-associated protein [Clostridiales bacterium]|nr:TIGR03936 family radical SAM-associated protein [Clostridiales bacterium]